MATHSTVLPLGVASAPVLWTAFPVTNTLWGWELRLAAVMTKSSGSRKKKTLTSPLQGLQGMEVGQEVGTQEDL